MGSCDWELSLSDMRSSRTRILCLDFSVLRRLRLIVILLQAAPFSGSKTVGLMGGYSSLTAATADIQTQTLGGADLPRAGFDLAI